MSKTSQGSFSTLLHECHIESQQEENRGNTTREAAFKAALSLLDVTIFYLLSVKNTDTTRSVWFCAWELSLFSWFLSITLHV